MYVKKSKGKTNPRVIIIIKKNHEGLKSTLNYSKSIWKLLKVICRESNCVICDQR